MHPAFSVILFTTVSGAGYGLLMLLGLGRLTDDWLVGLCGMLLSGLLIAIGLIASTYHLGHPERAWRALSQWRTSWLSREGVMALITFLPMIAYGAVWVLMIDPPPTWLGVVAIACASVTVICTGMIYASLKPIRHWHTPFVPVLFLLFAWMTGGLLYLMLAGFFDHDVHWASWNALAAVGLTWAVKAAYWQSSGKRRSSGSPGTATGLGHLGTVTQLEPPHTEQNYVMREMGFVIARRHAMKLRLIAVMLGCVVPLVLCVSILVFAGPLLTGLLATVAALLAMVGVLIERWLFFAEARHVVTLYYGASKA